MEVSIVDRTDIAPVKTAVLSYDEIRAFLTERREIAIIDVREEAVFAEAHPLFAANLPFSRLETDTYTRIPRLTTPVVVYDNGEGLAQKATLRFEQLGYTNVHLLQGGLEGWRSAGGELFQDVNSASKAFGEWVEAHRHTPSMSAPEVKALLDSNSGAVVVDARRLDEHQTMNIPGSTGVPGAELVLRIHALAPDPTTKIIVNCAGRTRSIIGTQSLVNAGIPNPVFALRNGTIGWTLAGQQLEHGQNRRFPDVNEKEIQQAVSAGRRVADLAGVKRTDLGEVKSWLSEADRTTYCFDVRTIEEYKAGHIPDFRFAEGGQLVQETDHFVPVRGARIVLADLLEVRADMTASWLAQMGWEVYVIDQIVPADFSETTPFPVLMPPAPQEDRQAAFTISVATLAAWKEDDSNTVVVDFSPARLYQKKHIPGAFYVLRSELSVAFSRLPVAERYVLTSFEPIQLRYVFEEFKALTDKNVYLLDGGNDAWINAGLAPEEGGNPEHNRFISPPLDRYRRPYEGTDNPVKAMEAYLEWEYGLVEQLKRDGTHGFNVI